MVNPVDSDQVEVSKRLAKGGYEPKRPTVNGCFRRQSGHLVNHEVYT